MQIVQNNRMPIEPGLRQRQQLTPMSSQLQLFTKLKKNKQLQQASSREPHKHETSFCSRTFQYLSKNNSRNSFSSLQLESFNSPEYGLEQNQHLMALTSDQIDQLERLKNDKIAFVVEASLKSGRPVKQIMEQYVMNQLEMQVWFIYVTGKRQENTRQKRQYPKKYNQIKQPLYNLESQYCLLNQDQQVWNKNLQSTAQYTEDSPARHIEKTTNQSKNNAINDGSNGRQNNLHFNRSKIKSGRRKDKSQSTIKNLQSPQPRSFSDDHNSNVLIQDYSKNKQQINIVQFTLGNVHDENQHQLEYHLVHTQASQAQHYDCDSQNFTERQAQIKENRVLDENSSNEKVVSFNKRRKLPKGKAIKFRVMGNINHEST